MSCRPLLSLCFIGLMSACGPAEQTGDMFANDFKDNVYNTTDHVTQWVKTPPAKPAPHEIANAYCYHVLQDIVCYHQPMPGWENRLVAYQGTHAEPPAPYTMELLPVRADASQIVVDRAAVAKPIIVLPEVPVKEIVKTTTTESTSSTVIDTTHEILPNPTTSPQL